MSDDMQKLRRDLQKEPNYKRWQIYIWDKSGAE